MTLRECVFCQIIAGDAPATIVREWDDAIAIVPLPYGISSTGYGFSMGPEGAKRSPHVIALELAGRPVSPGMEARHMCGRRICINPWHLQEGTHAQNMADMELHGTRLRGEAAPSAKLTEADVLVIRASSESDHVLGERFGVTPSNITAIRSRRSWKHLP